MPGLNLCRHSERPPSGKRTAAANSTMCAQVVSGEVDSRSRKTMAAVQFYWLSSQFFFVVVKGHGVLLVTKSCAGGSSLGFSADGFVLTVCTRCGFAGTAGSAAADRWSLCRASGGRGALIRSSCGRL